MLARLQGFPDDWQFGDKKTIACRMIGNAFPPPVAREVGLKIKHVLDYASINSRSSEEIPRRAVG
jgi:DNA (cytosine-5)-methyltransferase 1